MEKQSYISGRQALCLLIMTRLPFATSNLSALNAGRSVQDVLVMVPALFCAEFLMAVPFFLLFHRHPDKDPVECATLVFGRAGGAAVGIYYLLYFLILAAMTQSNFYFFYVNSFIVEAKYYQVIIPLLIVCIYGAIKGIETIARFGNLVIVVFLIVITVLALSLIPVINLRNVFPVFYSGPDIFFKSLLDQINLSYQMVLLAFLLPFLKRDVKKGKLYTIWNVSSSLLLFLIFFLIVTVLGPFGAKQFSPIDTLTVNSAVYVFERLDQVDMISWILNTVLIVALCLYMSSMCLTKVGVNKHRRLVVVALALVLYGAVLFMTGKIVFLGKFPIGIPMTVITVLSEIVIPLIIVAGDAVKGRIEQNEGA